MKTTARVVGVTALVVALATSVVAGAVAGDPATLFWGLWLVAFGVFEWRGLADRDPGGTLSEMLWRVLSYDRASPWPSKVRTVCLWLGLVWLTAHFLSGGAV